ECWPLDQAHRKVLEATSLRVVTSGRNITLRQKKEPVQMQRSVVSTQENITGTVTDAQSGETLPGVNILVKGTTTGASTDQNGSFELTAPSLQDTLVVTYIGYQRQEVAIDGRTEIDIQLTPEAIMGEEMVVVGYTQQQQEEVTGSVDQITSEDMTRRPMTNINQGLQGISPNVNINLQSGKPFESPSINIRGATSVGQGGDALVLIDGVEIGRASCRE